MSGKLPTRGEDRQTSFFKKFHSHCHLYSRFSFTSKIISPDSSTLIVYSVSYLIPFSTQPDHGDEDDDDDAHGDDDDDYGDADDHGGGDDDDSGA